MEVLCIRQVFVMRVIKMEVFGIRQVFVMRIIKMEFFGRVFFHENPASLCNESNYDGGFWESFFS